MDNYAEMVARHKMEMDALPLGFAFDQEQFRAMMESWGLDSNQDLTKIYRLPEIGAYIQKRMQALCRKPSSATSMRGSKPLLLILLEQALSIRCF